MTAATAAPAPNPELYDRWFARFRDASYRQGRAYAELASAKRKAAPELILLSRADEVLGIASVRIKQVPLIGIGIAYIDRGPLVSLDGDFHPQAMAAAVDALSQHFVVKRGLVLRIKPPSYGGRADHAMRAVLEPRGFRELPGARQQSFVIDLDQPLDVIRGRFHGKWRGHLSKAERSDLTITRATDQQSFAEFGALLDRLQQEKGFHSEQDATFFARCQALGSASEQMTLHLAWSGERLVAGHLGAYTGDTAVYVLGATSDEGRALRAAYLLQWEVIQFANTQGLRYYDLGGADAVANPDVHGFKERMGGGAIWNTPGFELAPGAVSRLIVHAAERLADLRRLTGTDRRSSATESMGVDEGGSKPPTARAHSRWRGAAITRALRERILGQLDRRRIVFRWDAAAVKATLNKDTIRIEQLAALPAKITKEVDSSGLPRAWYEHFFRQGATLWTVLEDDRALGSLWVIEADRLGEWYLPLEPDAQIIYGVVTPKWARGRGIAAQLALAAARGADGAPVYLDCMAWNRAAHRAFAKAGFVPVATVGSRWREVRAGPDA